MAEFLIICKQRNDGINLDILALIALSDQVNQGKSCQDNQSLQKDRDRAGGECRDEEKDI